MWHLLQLLSGPCVFWSIAPHNCCVCVMWRFSINSFLVGSFGWLWGFKDFASPGISSFFSSQNLITWTSLCSILYCLPSIYSVAQTLLSRLNCSAKCLPCCSVVLSALWFVHQIQGGRSGLFAWNCSRVWWLLTQVSTICFPFCCLWVLRGPQKSMLLVALGYGSFFHLLRIAWASILPSTGPVVYLSK